MAYTVLISPRARRDIRKQSSEVQRQIISRLEGLERDPRPSGVRKLSGEENLYRIRMGNYRILYQVRDQVLIVLVVGVGDRKEIYRRRPGR